MLGLLVVVSSVAMLLGLLTLVTVMIGRQMPQIAAALAEGAANGVKRPAVAPLHYAA